MEKGKKNIISKFDLSGRTAIVTGGARGLSYGIAEALHDAGTGVVLIDILDDVEKSAEKLSGDGERCFGVRADLLNREEIDIAFKQAITLLKGRLDILVNGAGIQIRRPAAEFPTEDWDKVIGLNLNTVFFMCQLAGRVMLNQKYGRIINIASMNAYFGGTIVPAYTASKAGVASLTRALSNEWAPHGINVNAIAPGYMISEMSKTMREVPGQIEELTKRIPAGRWGTEEDLKGIALYMASEASDYMTGATVPIDGGFMCR